MKLGLSYWILSLIALCQLGLRVHAADCGASAGTVDFRNGLVTNIDAPFFNDFGVRLSGTNYLVQLYAGIMMDDLVAIGMPTPFLTGAESGYFRLFPNLAEQIPFVCGGRRVWVQVRAWEAAGGRTFEQAALRGRWTGISNRLFIQTGNPGGGVPTAPAGLVGLQYPGPPLVVREPQDQKGRATGRATLSVIASTGIRANYQWYQGLNGDTNSPISGATNAVLTTPPLTTNTQFWVNIFDSAGSTNSASAKVTVYPSNSVILNLGLISGLAALAIDAPTGVPLRIEASENPRGTNRTALVDLQLTNTPFTFIDAGSSNAPARFYRVVGR